MYCIEEKNCDNIRTFRRPAPVIRRLGVVPPSLRLWCDTSRQIAKLWNSESPECRTTKIFFLLNSLNRENATTLVPPWIQNAPQKTGEACPAGETHGKATEMSSKDQLDWRHLRPCLVPSWCGASRTIWNCCWSRGIPSPSGAVAPATLPRGKAGMKMNDIYVSLSTGVWKCSAREWTRFPCTTRFD